ncbi:MAG TPA: acyl-CoA carboxylase subunit epsilon [Mycobacteriales bacterium]|nr:acyl-CoA carboxylase subunit epsilon [Mycobacteriales bacterium]
MSEQPTLRVVGGGEPTDEELAALIAVIAVRDAAPAAAEIPLRQPLAPWVASGLVKGTRTKV